MTPVVDLNTLDDFPYKSHAARDVLAKREKKCRICRVPLGGIHLAGCEYGVLTSVGVQAQDCD